MASVAVAQRLVPVNELQHLQLNYF